MLEIINNLKRVYNRISFDLDGVLCVGPKPEEDLGTNNYYNFLKNTVPLYTPNFVIEEIITGRRKRFLKDTLDWLGAYKIKYKKLYLKPNNIHVSGTPIFKAEIYKKSKANLYIESSKKQAEEIFNLSNKPVYCVESTKLYK